MDHEKNMSNAKKTQWIEDAVVHFKKPGEKGHEYVQPKLDVSVQWSATVVVMIIFFIIVFRSAFLQLVGGAYYAARAEGNRTRSSIIPAERGIIMDRHGTPFTKNIPHFSLSVIPRDIPSDPIYRDTLSSAIATSLGKERSQVDMLLLEASRSPDREFELFESIERQHALSIAARGGELPAVQISTSIRREYVGDSVRNASLGHVIGYEGKISANELTEMKNDDYGPLDRIGKQGIEAAYEYVLHGKKGVKKIEVDAAGIALGTLSELLPIRGADVELTLDAALQEYAEKIFTDALRALKKRRGALLVEHARTGEILAMVSAPTFSANDFSRGVPADTFEAILKDKDSPLINRVIAGQFPSGSVVKPALAIAGLAEGVITAHTTVHSMGGIQVGERFFEDWKKGGHGIVRLNEAIAHSVNTYFYILGGGYEGKGGLGIERILLWLGRFGFGQRRAIDIPGEARGFVPSPQNKEERKKEQWFIGDTYNLSIGQGDFLVTPLQISGVVSAIINDGVRLTPHLLKRVLYVNGRTEEYKDIGQKKIDARPDDFQLVREAMRDTVRFGSGKSLKDLSIAVAGKTGTAQSSAGKEPHAWFTGFAPYQNPEIIVTLLVEEGGEGSKIAAPIAGKIFEWWKKFGNG